MSVTSPCARPDLLFLAPCLPYPPDRGHRLRWFQMLKYLAQRHRVHVGAVIDPRTSPAQLARIRAIAYETCFVAPPAIGGRLRSFGRAGGGPDELAAWVADIAGRCALQGALACSARMASYVADLPPGCVRICDFVDLESDRLEERARTHRWPAGRMLRRTALSQRSLELCAPAALDHVLFATHAAAERYCARAPQHAPRVLTVGSGVDADYFSPHILHRNPFQPDCRPLVFAGAMDDWGNADAAEWFVFRVLPALRTADPTFVFHIVGARPAQRVLALARQPGVVVTGAVGELRPWFAHAELVVAPRHGSHGGHDEILQAMAMRQIVLATPHAVGGIGVQHGAELLLAADETSFIDAILKLPGATQRSAMGAAARAKVQRGHSWKSVLAPLGRLLEPATLRQACGG